MRKVGILIFDDVEVLDFCGPFEVFAVTGRREQLDLFQVHTMARSRPVLARGGLSVNPHHTLIGAPTADILVIPGGFGTRREMDDPEVTDWIAQSARAAEVVLSVCTGALLLAKAGLLDGLSATTHHGALDLLEQVAAQSTIERDRRVIDNGKVVVAAGVSAGIDAA
ncbi:MAG: DJ-1/PfpI family protein, partial [Longimicrobiales bacterium]